MTTKKELIEKTSDYKQPRAKVGKPYFYIDERYRVVTALDWYEDWDNERYQIGNYYLSEEECKHTATCNQTKQKLKLLALKLNKGVEIKWDDDEQGKYYIVYYVGFNKDLHLLQHLCLREMGQIYCLDEDFLEIAKQEIGEEKLIELIKSGV